MGNAKTGFILFALLAALFGKPHLATAQSYSGLGGEPLGFTDADCKKMYGLCSGSSKNMYGVLSCAPLEGCCTQDTDCPSTDVCHPGVCQMAAGASTGQCLTKTRDNCHIDIPSTAGPGEGADSCTTSSDCPYAGNCTEAVCLQGSCSYQLPTGKTYADLPDECKCAEPSACDDGNPCTLDSCRDLGDRRGLCLRKAAAMGTSCDDGLFCNGSDYCEGGQCMKDTPPCQDEDGSECTETVCDEAKDQCLEKTLDCQPPFPAPDPIPPTPETGPTEPAPRPHPIPTPTTPPPPMPSAPEVPATPPSPVVSCSAESPDDVFTDADGTQVIFAITKEGLPTPVALRVSAASGTEKFLAAAEKIEWRQDTGTTLVSPSAPQDENDIKSFTEPTLLTSDSASSEAFRFVAPLPYAGRGKAIETYSFTATAKDLSGRILWSAPVDCRIGLEIKGGGGGGGCSLIR